MLKSALNANRRLRRTAVDFLVKLYLINQTTQKFQYASCDDIGDPPAGAQREDAITRYLNSSNCKFRKSIKI